MNLSDPLSSLAVVENNKLLVSLLSPKAPRDVFPLSLAQQRLWLIDQLCPGNAAYNVPFAMQLRGKLNVGALQMSVRDLTERHEVLRAHFVNCGGCPVQIVTTNNTIEVTLLDLTGILESSRNAEAYRLATEEVALPFDLAVGPPLRLKLYRLGPEEHLLLCVMHHIVCDGWSLGIFVRELSVLYNQYCDGLRASLPALPIHYGDYAKWQREWVAGNLLSAQLQYWKIRLEGAPLFLPLPADHARPDEQSYDGASQILRIPRELVRQLAEFGRTRRATLFMVMLSVFKALLHSYSGMNEILVGVPVAGRNRMELEDLIGFFVNTLVLRADFSRDPRFEDLLLQVREASVEAFAHADLPFEKLVEELNPPRDLSYTPLVQVMFSTVKVRDFPSFGSVSALPFILGTPKSLFDVSFEFIEDVNDLWWLRVVYATALFESARMVRMLDDYLALLAAVVKRPELRVSELRSILARQNQVEPSVRHQPESLDIRQQKESTPALQEDVQPRDALEWTLIRIWERVLGVSRIGVRDNFFDLGGHSLLAARLVTEVGKAVGRSVPLSALFRGSTIESFAQAIRCHDTWTPDPLLMEINAGTHGSPLFAIVQSGVDSLGYALLARHMGVERSFYKLQGRAPFCPIVPFSIEELRTIAREYVAAMRAIQPSGPYFLVAMCNGVHIAEQMVIELEALGLEVGFLAVIDTFVLQFSEIRWLARIEAFRVGRRELLSLPLAQQAWHYKRALKNRLRRLFLSERPPLSPWTAAVWPGKDFQPEQFRAPVILFKRPKQPYFKVRDPRMGWGARTSSGVEIFTVNVAAHHAMLREPAVHLIAEHLKEALHCMEPNHAPPGRKTMNGRPSYPGSSSQSQSRFSPNGPEHGAGGERDAAAEAPAAKTSDPPPVTNLERTHPLVGSKVAGPRSMTVIRSPAFSFGAIVSGIRTLASYRDLLYTFTVFRLTVRYKQSILGWVWAALQPIAMMAIYTLVFSRVAKVRSEGLPYPLFVFCGLLPWIFFSSAVNNAINGMVSHTALITKLYFPREIIPLSYVLAVLVDFFIASFLLCSLMFYYHIPLGWKTLYTLPVVAVLIAFTSAVALFLSSVQVRFRDTAAALPAFLQLGVFATPVAYSVESIPSRFQRLYLLNPLASLIENFRRVFLRESVPDVPALYASGVLTLLCLAVAYAYFKTTESTMSDVI